jgi:type III pantothenate kinase
VAVLLIDVGNTRIKWARLKGEDLGHAHAAVHANWRTEDYARRLIGAVAPERILASSVAGPAVRFALTQAARRRRVPISFVSVPARRAGITVGYAESWRLGVDRFIGMVAAHHLFGGVPVCVAGIGTALTLDLIARSGRHFGGAIIPGPVLMVGTLLSSTWGIRRRATGGRRRLRGPFGRSTRDAIEAGAHYAAAALIDRAVDEATALVGRPPLVVLTGGGAAGVRPLLHSPAVGVPDLVLRGLAVLATQPRAR